jgi:hypothetical protein
MVNDRGRTAALDDGLAQVALALDAETAERWADVLERAGIEAHIRIVDGAPFRPLGSVYGQIHGGEPFAYPVLVSRVQHRAAVRTLERLEDAAGLAGGSPLSPRRVATAVAVLAASMALVAYLAWARGEL